MSTSVFATTTASIQIENRVDAAHELEWKQFTRDLKLRGCAAVDYRLTGSKPVGHICSKHLWDKMRALVAWLAPNEAWIVAVGPHNNSKGDIYRQLYTLAGVDAPVGERTKPGCCDDGLPPEIEAKVAVLVQSAKQVSKAEKRSIKKKG